MIEAIRLSDKRHADALHRRYCDFWLVDGEMELHAPKAEKEPEVAPSATNVEVNAPDISTLAEEPRPRKAKKAK